MVAFRLIPGDCLAGLATLPDASVHCCVTSPPYWGLRDYGTGRWIGGDPTCDHSVKSAPRAERPASGLTGGKATVDAGTVRRGDCPCGAHRIDEQIGLEPTPAEYVEKMVAVFREVRRVLRDDGTLWLNLGDSYAGSWGAQSRPDGNDIASTLRGASALSARQIKAHPKETGTGSLKNTPGLKAKDLVGIPWRVAFALQADGWYLRSDIIWSKPNPMPESVTDRPTKAHEYLFLLSKSERYHYDAGAIAEQSVIGAGAVRNISPANKGTASARNDADRFGVVNDGTRNKRTVWTIPSEPFPGAHFAVMPTALVKPCILAGCPTGGTVLDPFGGSGTVAVVALEQGCGAVLLELNPAYCEIIRQRVGNTTPATLLGGVA